MIAGQHCLPVEVDGLDRRRFLGSAALLAAILGGQLGACVASPAPEDATAHLAVLERVCAIVIPRSDTPGSDEVGGAAFVVLALAHGLEGGRPDQLGWLAARLDRDAGGSFVGQSPTRQGALVAALDGQAYAGAPADLAAWRTIKALILTGYYTSEAGATRELQYQLVPGRFDPDAPLHPGDRAWSSDWTAVAFG